MNADILKMISTDKLFELKTAVEAEINNRIDYRIASGRTGTFTDSKTQQLRKVLITRVNTKTVSCQETYDSINPGNMWKVGINLIKMDGVKLKETSKNIEPKNEKPSAAYNVQAW